MTTLFNSTIKTPLLDSVLKPVVKVSTCLHPGSLVVMLYSHWVPNIFDNSMVYIKQGVLVLVLATKIESTRLTSRYAICICLGLEYNSYIVEIPESFLYDF
jgi:hypothetical protein